MYLIPLLLATVFLANTEIQVIKHNHDLLFRVPRPNQVLKYQTVAFITINGIILSLDIVPPYSSRHADNTTYIKVLSGRMMWTDSSTSPHQPVNHSRAFLCELKDYFWLYLKHMMIVHNIQRNDDIRKVTIANPLPEYYSPEVRQLVFQFVKNNRHEPKENFKDCEFYNLKGFEISFSDNDEHLCYMQLWAAGQSVNDDVHNHTSDDALCEVHACSANGNGRSGMHYLNSSKQFYDPLTTPKSTFEKLELPSFHEHGPLWNINVQNRPVLRNDSTVVYA
ncbi:unnamed protein product [Rotaria socialis]|nr:unnamed protein product [Rotaria socialis]CAF3649114.1 unnamed protein product [Rotaria socialis]CAF3663893.1 unnamed protein product [Rotaria socialis]CAF4310656.1 unnamed protein product [Rotaria socialis]